MSKMQRKMPAKILVKIMSAMLYKNDSKNPVECSIKNPRKNAT